MQNPNLGFPWDQTGTHCQNPLPAFETVQEGFALSSLGRSQASSF